MHIDDETIARQLHRLLQSRDYKISLCTVLRCRSGSLAFRGSTYCQLVRNVNKQKRREWAKANLMDAILKTFSRLMSVVSKWRASHRRFCCRKIGDAPKPKPRHMHVQVLLFYKRALSVSCKRTMQRLRLSHPLANTF